MSFNDAEKSLDGRKPIRLYKFTRGALVWAYNTSSEPIKRDNVIYKSLVGGISDRGIIRSDGSSNSDSFTITAPADIDVAKLFYGMPPNARIELEVANSHLQTEEIVKVWFGAVVSVRDTSTDKAEIIAAPFESLANTTGVNLTYSRQCGAVIYDQQCKVNKELHRIRTSIQQLAITGIVTSDAAKYADGYFSGGFIEYTIEGGEIERRYIEQHSGINLTLWGGSQGLEAGQAVSLFTGCNQSPDMCNNKFNNYLNRRSFEHLQGRSPFDGNQVF